MSKKKEYPEIPMSERNALNRYLEEVLAHPRLDEKEEQELALLAAEGNQKAAQKLVEGNLWHVVNIAKQYIRKGVDIEDIINEGNIGMLRAVNHYDVKRKVRFATYATQSIKRQIEQAIDKQPEINQRIKESATNSLEIMKDTTSPGADNGTILQSMKTTIEDSFYILTEREQKVLERVYGINHEPMTFAEIGEELGLKRERVRQIRKKALQRLSKATHNKQLKTFLPN